MSEFPMKKYELNVPWIEAIEVTPQYVLSLPSAGNVLQRFGEQVEIMSGPPHYKKSYAVYGDFIILTEDPNGKPVYIVVSGPAFNGLFDERELSVNEKVIAEQKEYETYENIPEKPKVTPIVSSKPFALQDPKRQERIKNLQEKPTTIHDTPLGEEK